VTEFRPELADHHYSSIEGCIEEPSLPGLCPVAVLLRIVSGRDAGCCSGAEYLGEIDRVLTTVIPRHDETAKGISGAMHEASPAKAVVAVVIMKHNRQKRFHKKLLACLVSEVVPIVTAISRSPLSNRRVFLISLTDTSLGRREDEGGGSEAVKKPRESFWPGLCGGRTISALSDRKFMNSTDAVELA
jgi:hypothetical protein